METYVTAARAAVAAGLAPRDVAAVLGIEISPRYTPKEAATSAYEVVWLEAGAVYGHECDPPWGPAGWYVRHLDPDAGPVPAQVREVLRALIASAADAGRA
jgi:hypothetical protein